MLSAADEQTQSNFIISLTSPQDRKLITMILHPSTPSSIKMPDIQSVTLKLYFSRKIQTFKITSGLLKSQYYLQENCFIQYFRCVKMENSHSRYAEPVYRKRWRNQCYNAPGFAVTETAKYKLQVHGVLPN